MTRPTASSSSHGDGDQRKLSSFFSRNTREDGTAYTVLNDDAPSWLYDAVREAHDDELPNDWRYDTCRHICAMIDDGEDDPCIIGDSLVDFYNSDVMAWASQNSRWNYADGYAEEYGDDGEDACIIDRIRLGQFYCIMQMASILVNAVRENAEDSGDDDADE